jgi:hypothetical protein
LLWLSTFVKYHSRLITKFGGGDRSRGLSFAELREWRRRTPTRIPEGGRLMV